MKHQGLTNDQVIQSRTVHGSNELRPASVESFWDKLSENFKSPIIVILLVALVIILTLSFFGLTEWYEAVAIGFAVLLATGVSTFSEYKNESSFQRLQEEASRINCKVYRDGSITEIPIGQVVVEDLVLLQAGDKIPADGRVFEGKLKVNQASLTGESEAVTKVPGSDGELKDHHDLSSPFGLFRGAVVEDGEAIMKIQEVGNQTVYGKLSEELSISNDRPSPLQEKLRGLARLIAKFGYIAAVMVAVVFIFHKAIILNDFDAQRITTYLANWEIFVNDITHALVLAIIIVVAAVPEGLPMMIAIVLSLNMRKMLREKVLVRKLLGIETAGSLNILFSDKTGTLTKGKLEAQTFTSGNEDTYAGYAEIPESLREVMKLAILGNTSSYKTQTGQIVGGNFSERALFAYVAANDDLAPIDNLVIKSKVLFNSTRKYSATRVHLPAKLNGLEETHLTFVKGAPEIVLGKCNTYIDQSGNVQKLAGANSLLDYLDETSETGMRLIALAVSSRPILEDALPDELHFIGAVGLRDSIRETTRESVEEVKMAGIQVVMMTGDRKGTARAIAEESGILENEQQVILQSSQLNEMSDEEIAKLLPDLRVISRALPTDKSRLVRISKSLGKVVGMTGDGVNDSAALKQSDLGIAMGSGSEVTKEAGDIVIMDDNFYSISNAVRYGRTVFKSIRKFIMFQLTVNVAAVSITFLGPLIGVEFPLTIIQLLWINMIMDTLAAMALGGEPALHRYMKEPPVTREENILTKPMIQTVLFGGLFITFFAVFFLKYPPIRELFTRDGLPDHQVFMTAFFNIFIFQILFNAFNVRSEGVNILEHLKDNLRFLRIMGLIFGLQVVFTYVGGDILRTTALTMEHWLLVLLLSVIVIPLDMIRKVVSGPRKVTATEYLTDQARMRPA